MKQDKDKDVINVDQCAELTGYAKSTIYHKVSAKAIPYFKSGGRTRFSRIEIIKFFKL